MIFISGCSEICWVGMRSGEGDVGQGLPYLLNDWQLRQLRQHRLNYDICQQWLQCKICWVGLRSGEGDIGQGSPYLLNDWQLRQCRLNYDICQWWLQCDLLGMLDKDCLTC